MPASNSLLSDFRRFTNAVKAKSSAAQKTWSFTADARVGILVVTVNEGTSPERAEELTALVERWQGRVHREKLESV